MVNNLRNTAWYCLKIEKIQEQLRTSSKGLNNNQIDSARNEFGYNEFEKTKKKTLIVRFLEQFKSFMIIILIIAAVVSGIIGIVEGESFIDSLIILGVVILNAVIGVVQEAKAEESLEALEKMSAPQCKVIRDGIQQIIPSRELVPGDLVVLDTGDSVPADLRLTESINLKIQESALTGESVPVEKDAHLIFENEIPLGDRRNMAFSAGTVTYGRGKGIVVAAGMQTEVGKIAEMIQSVPDTTTPLQRKLNDLGKGLGIISLVACVIIFIIGILYGKDLMEMFMTAVSLAVAAIPEGLPAIATVVLAVGVQRLAKKKAIVRTLPSVEVLGCTTVICSDKTGTLTQNKMTVTHVFSNQSTLDFSNDLNITKEQSKLFEIAILCNDTKLIKDGTMLGDPTETALVDAGLRISLDKNTLEQKYPRKEEIPFDSERKLMTTVHARDNNYEVYTKGALDELLACCETILLNGEIVSLTTQHLEVIKQANREMAQNALRVLAMAYKNLQDIPEKRDIKNLETELTFVGMLGMIDPPRPEVKDAVKICRDAGIKPVMITGDHKITAEAIAKSLGILQENHRAITGSELDMMQEEELMKNIDDIDVYARVSPENKVRIVKAFQQKQQIVAMTGDGVNDAPALKLADIGTAMGITGTDVSKQASDIILTDDNFATIVTAVGEGRRIYNNIIKAIHFLLATNIGEILLLFVAVLLNWATPLMPIHILMINLVTDSLPALALSVDPADKDIMKQKPSNANQKILNKAFVTRILIQGAMMSALSLIAFRIGCQTSVAVGQTMAFGTLALSQLVHIFNVRSEKRSAFRGMFTNKYLWGAIMLSAGIVLAILEIPVLHSFFQVSTLTGIQWLIVIGLSSTPLPLVELTKLIRRFIKK